MIACPQPLNAWHITSGRLGQALCGLAGDNLRITTPELIGARDESVCPDCWQEFFTGRLTAPVFWYEEETSMVTATKRDHGLTPEGSFDRPEVVQVKVAKTYDTTIKLMLAEHDAGWVFGYDIYCRGRTREAIPPTTLCVAVPSRAEALEAAIFSAMQLFEHLQVKNAGKVPILRSCEAACKAMRLLLDKVRAGMNSGRGGRHAVEKQQTKNPSVRGSNAFSGKNGRLPHPATTSTTTPAGIATLDGAAEGFTDDVERLPSGVQKVPLHLIAASPFQPRINPAEARIAELAESMQSWGFKGPIELRPIAKGQPMFARGKEQARYELIDGERRLRAANQAGLTEIPALVREMDDATAEEHVLLANEGREDLSPLERGRVIQRLLQMGHSQTAVGKMLGLTQGAVSNKTRILELPSEWLDGSIHPEISASEAHLREVCVYRASRPLLDKLAAAIRKEAKRKEWDLPSVGEWREDLRYQTRAITEPMEGTQWDSKSYRSIPIFTPTEAQRAKLQIVQVPDHQGKPEERAANVKLWKQLQGEHAAELRKQTAKKQDAKQKKAAAQQKKLSPAEQKRREKEQAEQFAKRLRAWRIDWLQWLCYVELRDSRHVTPDGAMLLTPFFATSQAGGDNNWNGWSWHHRQYRLKAAIAKRCPAWKASKGTGSRSDPWGWLRQCYELGGLAAVENAIDQWQCWCLWIEEDDAKELQCDPGAQNALPPEVIEGLADLLRVDLAATWSAEMAGPLTYRFFSLHTKEQLLALGQELKVPLPASAGKADLVQALIDAKPARMPQEIVGAK